MAKTTPTDRQFIKYCIVGASGVVINTLVLFYLTENFHIWYILSSWVGVLIAFVSNFILNKWWTFKA